MSEAAIPTVQTTPTVQTIQTPLPIQAVSDPILNKPFAEPARHWLYNRATGEASLQEGRRASYYWYKTQERAYNPAQGTLELLEEQRPLDMVNNLRQDVRRWRERGYPGATRVTRDLLRHWTNPDRARRLFFCQVEAVETIIFLTEIRAKNPDGSRRKPLWTPAFTDAEFGALIDTPDLPDSLPLVRYGCKMATGTGKTVVMAMLISWAFCNRGRVPSDERFPRAALICCPNITIRDRLAVLRPDNPDGDYYTQFDMVPAHLMPEVKKGRVLITNWHAFAPESAHHESGRNYTVVNKGPEDDEAFARNRLGDLYDAAPLMVLNDEGHHAYRPAPIKDKDKMTAQEAKEAEEQNRAATVWIQGLDRLNAACGDKAHGKSGIAVCVDLSATPFYIKGSGYPEGEPFRWLVSDFSLVDAIESGLTKIPRLPVVDTTGRPDARYFKLWSSHIVKDLAATQKQSNGKPKPEVVWERAQDALVTLASQYKKMFDVIEDANDLQLKAPPVMIIVCDNTDIADIFHRGISGEIETEDDTPDASDTSDLDGDDGGSDDEAAAPSKKTAKARKRTVYTDSRILPPLFQNGKGQMRTLRIDSKLLAKAESEEPGATREKAAEELRRIVSTVGRIGEPGAYVRCVVSVAMLTEGWDANNVTHILGLRAFGSQLLCEQVVGRGLRRMNYDIDPDTGMFPPEYVDVYGIPFSVIPYKGQSSSAPPPAPPPNHVYALKERRQFEITFPNVEGYVFALKKNLIRADIRDMETLRVVPDDLPTALFVRPASGYSEGGLASLGPGEFHLHNREEYYASEHLQHIEFEIARQIVAALVGDGAHVAVQGYGKMRGAARHQLFPQVLRLVHGFVRDKVELRGVNPCELGLDVYVSRIVGRLLQRIEPDASEGEPPLLPLLNRYKPTGTTADVNFLTTRQTTGTQRSHVNSVVQDSMWEKASAFYLEALAGEPDSVDSKPVSFYVRNERPFLRIPYEYEGVSHAYEPDYLVRLRNGLTVVLEIKGQEPDKTQTKHEAARRWERAVNNWGKLGQWKFHVCYDPQVLGGQLTHLASQPAPAPSSP